MIKKWLYNHLQSDACRNTGLSFINILAIIFIIASILLQVIETDALIFNNNASFFFKADIFFAGFFTIETFSRIWCITESKKYSEKGGRKRYIISAVGLIDLITLIPFFLTIGVSSWLWGALRVTRILSLLKYKKIIAAVIILFNSIAKRRYELFVTVMIFVFLMLLSATALYLIEHKAQPKAFGSIAQSLWWSVVTLTTVAYGDIYPITAGGKFFAAITMLLGIGVFAMPTGILAASFSHAFQEKFENKITKKLHTEEKILHNIEDELHHMEKKMSLKEKPNTKNKFK